MSNFEILIFRMKIIDFYILHDKYQNTIILHSKYETFNQQ